MPLGSTQSLLNFSELVIFRSENTNFLIDEKNGKVLHEPASSVKIIKFNFFFLKFSDDIAKIILNKVVKLLVELWVAKLLSW